MRRTSTDRAYLEDGTVIIDADGIEVELPPNNHTHHRLDNSHGTVTLDASGGLQHWVGGTRRWWVNQVGTLREGTVPTSRVDGLEGRLAALEYDSGLRNVTSLLALTAGAAYLNVRNGWARLLFNNAVPAGTGNVVLTATGFLSVAPQSPIGAEEGSVGAGASWSPRRLEVNRNGQVRVYAVGASDVLNGSLTWPMTRPIPALWPGNPT